MKNKNNEWFTPNKYRENPEFDEDGVRSDADATGATLALIVGAIAVLIIAVELIISFF